MKQVLIRVVLVFLVCQAAWYASAIFEVRPYVSALYLGCGVTFMVGLVLGWRYLPAVYLATLVLTYVSFPELNAFELWGAPLRQTLIYGLAGLSLRPMWLDEQFRLSMPVALRFTVTALLASLASAATALQMPPFALMTPDEKAEVFFSFWGGDFAGSMLLVPMLLQLHFVLFRRSSESDWATDWTQWLRAQMRKDYAGLCLLGVGTSLITMSVPHWLGSDVSVDMLTILPVLLAALWRGAYIGFVVAVLVSMVQILPAPG